jgi:hypothetical protein
MTIGVALPQDALTTDASEFIGYLVGTPLSYICVGLMLTAAIAVPLKQHDLDRMVWYILGWPNDKQFASHGLPV